MTIAIACPCGARIEATEASAGKEINCPKCSTPHIVPGSGASPVMPMPGAGPAPGSGPGAGMGPGGGGLPGAARMGGVAPRQTVGGGTFAPERMGIRKGMVGGLVMMAIAAVWFFGGLAAGYIFYYPPILFIVGVYAFLKGLFTGNIRGEV